MKGGDLDTDMHTERMPCEGRQAKDLQRLPANPQKLGEKQGTDTCSQPSETTLVDLVLDFLPPKLWDTKFLLFKSLGLWYFVMGNSNKLIQLGSPNLCLSTGSCGPGGHNFLLLLILPTWLDILLPVFTGVWPEVVELTSDNISAWHGFLPWNLTFPWLDPVPPV